MLNTARIAKNTIFLYLRMILVLAANFLAVRVLLDVLGVDDYGLFNLIVGFVTLFTLLNGAMMSTVQRFLCFELGRAEAAPPVDAIVSIASDRESDFPRARLGQSRPQSSTRLIFTLCFWLFVALALLIVLVSETGGLWFVHNKLNIPPGRFHTAQIVYQLSILVMVFKTMQIPYTALIVSYERMNAFAKISIVEAVLTLAAAYALKLLPSSFFLHTSNLVVYSVLYAISQGIVCLTYALYCRHHFAEGHLVSLFPVDAIVSIASGRKSPHSPLHLLSPPTFSLLRSLSSFFSWSILGAVANMLKQQGLNVLLNLFFGVAFNATWAVANKIGMAVSQVVGNFQQAFNPQIVKQWASGDKESTFKLLMSTSKYSFFLIWLFALPLLLETNFFLGLWLKGEVPPQLTLFVRLTIVYYLFDALSGPLWMLIQATGRIAKYQIQLAVITAASFVLSWLALHLGADAWSILAVNLAFNAFCFFYRLVFLKFLVGLPFFMSLRCIVLPACLVSIVAVGVFSPLMTFITNKWLVIPALVGISLIHLAEILGLGLSATERAYLFERLRSIRNRRLQPK